MPTFKAGEVIVEWRADLKKLKADNAKVESLSTKAGEAAAKKYKTAFDKNLNGRGSGAKFSKDFSAGVNAGKTGKQNGQKVGKEFQAGLKGSFKGFNLGAVFSAANLGIKIVTLAVNTISASIKKAEQREAEFKRELEEVNQVARESAAYLLEVDRLQNLLGDSALSAAQKVDVLGGAYETLNNRLNGIAINERKSLLLKETESRAKLVGQIAKQELEIRRSRADFAVGTAFGGGVPIDDTELLSDANEKLSGFRDSLRRSLVNTLKITFSRTPAELQEEIRVKALRESLRLTNQLNIARAAGDADLANDLSDQLVFEAKRREFARAFVDDPSGDAQEYIDNLKAARKQNELNQEQIKSVAKAEADALAIAKESELTRKAERNEAKQLFATSRTAAEEYAATLENLNKIGNDKVLKSDAGGDETIERQRIAALLKLAQTTEDAKMVFAEFDRLRKAGSITTAKETGVLEKLNDALGITADREKALAKAEEERQKKESELAFLEERKIDRQLLLARLANDNTNIEKLERQLALEQRIQELQEKGGKSKDDAREQASREIAEEDVAAARGVFRSGFSDGLRAAIDGDLGSFLEDKLKDLASGMFDRAVENLADAVFDQLAQIAPGFLGQITGNANLPQSLSGAAGAATNAVGGVANQVAGAGTQAAGSAGTATAITTALSTGGATLATSVTAAMTTGGTTTAAAIGTSMTTAGAAVAAQIAAAMASSGVTTGLSNFAGPFATGGVIGTGKFGLVGENGPELISAGSGPLRITPIDGGLRKQLDGFSTNGLASRGSNQSTPSNVVMNIAGVKDLASFVKSQGTIEADMAAAMRRAQADF